jgi:serine/threonine-protein kinase
MLRVGDKVGDYEVLERIKAGGMGALYLARRTGAAGFARPVAIKVTCSRTTSRCACSSKRRS